MTRETWSTHATNFCLAVTIIRYTAAIITHVTLLIATVRQTPDENKQLQDLDHSKDCGLQLRETKTLI